MLSLSFAGSYEKEAFPRARAWLQPRVVWGTGGNCTRKLLLGAACRELCVPRAAAGEGQQVAACCRAVRVAPPCFHLLAVFRLHPHTHTILTLLIQRKEKLMFSAWTGHHKLFFHKQEEKTPLPPTASISPPSSLLPSSLVRPHGLCDTEGTKGC